MFSCALKDKKDIKNLTMTSEFIAEMEKACSVFVVLLGTKGKATWINLKI